jgi:sec-independent protein translocase protein TatA
MFGLNPLTVIAVLVIGVLLFGKDLPEVARKLGKGLMEFKRGLQGLEDDFVEGRPSPRLAQPAPRNSRPPQRKPATAPKFEDKPMTDASA